MTLEELLGKTADEWDQLTPESLLEWATKYFSVTKPEEAQKTHQQLAMRGMAPKNNAPAKTRITNSKIADTLAQIEMLRKQHGIK